MKQSLIKIISKVFIFALIFIFISFSFIIIRTKGNYIVFDDSNTAGYQVTETKITNINTTKHTLDKGTTFMGGVFYNQQINVLSQLCNNDAKVVTWAIKNVDGSGFIRNNIAAIARDYEKNHPGWKVTGGINADQYYPIYGVGGHTNGSDYFYPQPYGPFIADGEKWFSISAKPYGGNGTYIAGFLNDGSKDPIVEGKTNWSDSSDKRVYVSDLYLSVIDEFGNVEDKYKIEKFNETPSVGESTLYTSFYQEHNFPDLVVNGENLYFVGNAELAYVSNSTTYTYKAVNDQMNINNAQNAFFGKGTISSIGKSFTLSKGQFAIDTKNPYLMASLAIGKRIIVQYEYEGQMNNVESATAYHTIMRMDNKDNNSTSSYNTKRYPRSIFGRTSGGSMVLLTIDGLQDSKGMVGANQYEGNAILKNYGVVEAYQMDGGGSVTMIVRENGDFKVVNSPSDGSARSVLTALFFVTRDLCFETKQTSSTANSLTLTTKITKTFERSVEEVYVKINNNQYKVENNLVTITNLEPGKEYLYRIYVKDEKGITATDYTGRGNTSKESPSLILCPYTKAEGKFIFTPRFNGDKTALTTVTLKIGSIFYEQIDEKFTIDNFQYTDEVVLIYKYKTSIYEEEITVEQVNPLFFSTILLEYLTTKNQNFMTEIYK